MIAMAAAVIQFQAALHGAGMSLGLSCQNLPRAAVPCLQTEGRTKALKPPMPIKERSGEAEKAFSR